MACVIDPARRTRADRAAHENLHRIGWIDHLKAHAAVKANRGIAKHDMKTDRLPSYGRARDDLPQHGAPQPEIAMGRQKRNIDNTAVRLPFIDVEAPSRSIGDLDQIEGRCGIICSVMMCLQEELMVQEGMPLQFRPARRIQFRAPYIAVKMQEKRHVGGALRSQVET